ncbi:MAG: sensor domain-containing diguanylate cyclase [Magnetovibrio sp.]|nr:sensor domain-containing diguanylate cyclase [Magnetovibrio sp.]
MDSVQNNASNNNEHELLERYRKLAKISTDWFWETDENYVVTYMSESVERITGMPRETYIGMSRFDLASEDTKKTPEWQHHIEQIQNHEKIKNFEYKHVGTDGHIVYLRVNAVPLFHDDGTFHGYLGTTADISELVMAKNHLEATNRELHARSKELEAAKLAAEHLARTDTLTGLNNRRAFFEQARTIDELCKRYKHLYSIIMMDIDFFKKINDTHGHAAGDKALKVIADTLIRIIRTSDVAGRIGGEEFAIILPQTQADSAENLAERLRKGLESSTIDYDCGSLSLTASFGVAQYAGDTATIEEIVSHADDALYQAKHKGRNCVVVTPA